MHLRSEHAVRDLPTLHAFIHAHPLGILTTSLSSENYPTLQCSHIPWVLDTESTEQPESSNGISNAESHPPFLGVMRGHIARANPQSKAMVEAVTQLDTQTPDLTPIQGYGRNKVPDEILIVFTSPVDHYITPHFYTESRPATGKVAPTWNYAAVQVYGRATIYHDAKDEATGLFLNQQLFDLARLGEEGIMGFQDETETTTTMHGHDSQDVGDASLPSPWKLADAPAEYISALKRNIVGIHVDITRIEGRFKVSQERPVNDRRGVVEGLERMQTVRAQSMAEFVKSGRVVSSG